MPNLATNFYPIEDCQAGPPPECRSARSAAASGRIRRLDLPTSARVGPSRQAVALLSGGKSEPARGLADPRDT